ncbi:MAG: hypothetical protein IT518_20805 [Burkholderiales bacterium]|nr:hypothetical protein [Burkholderiales bacterium]
MIRINFLPSIEGCSWLFAKVSSLAAALRARRRAATAEGLRGRARRWATVSQPLVTLLLDTQVAIWWLVGSHRLGGQARKLLARSACVISADKAWRDYDLRLAIV